MHATIMHNYTSQPGHKRLSRRAASQDNAVAFWMGLWGESPRCKCLSWKQSELNDGLCDETMMRDCMQGCTAEIRQLKLNGFL